MRLAQVVNLALLKKCVILIAIPAIGASVTRTARSEVLFFLVKVMDRVGGKGRVGLSSKRRVGDGVRKSTGTAEVDDVAEGEEASQDEKQAVCKSQLADVNSSQ